MPAPSEPRALTTACSLVTSTRWISGPCGSTCGTGVVSLTTNATSGQMTAPSAAMISADFPTLDRLTGSAMRIAIPANRSERAIAGHAPPWRIAASAPRAVAINARMIAIEATWTSLPTARLAGGVDETSLRTARSTARTISTFTTMAAITPVITASSLFSESPFAIRVTSGMWACPATKGFA